MINGMKKDLAFVLVAMLVSAGLLILSGWEWRGRYKSGA